MITFHSRVSTYQSFHARRENFTKPYKGCLGGGKYCVPNYSYDNATSVQVDIFSSCIQRLNTTKWFSFAIGFKDNCLKSGNKIDCVYQ